MTADTSCFNRNFWGTEFPILLLVVVLPNCMRYVHKFNERKMYVPTLRNDYARDKN